jgi:hypothetical protein
VTQPPYGSDPGRPQDRPQDSPRSFPTYGRPQHAQQPGGQQPQGQQPGGQWAAPGQPPPPQLPPPPQQPPYGQAPYGQAASGQQAPYGQGYGPAQYPTAYGQPPAAYGYGYGYPGERGGTNGLATAALATGLGGLIFGFAAPVAIGLGIAALVQLKKRPQDGKGMAIAGLVIGSVITVGYIVFFGVLIAIGSTVDDDYGAPEPVSSYSGSTTYVDELAVGECFDDGDEEGEVVRRPCAQVHDGEVISNLTLPDGPYPGEKAVTKASKSSCAADFAKYVGNTTDKSELDLAWWSPDEDLWEDEDRLVICAAYGPPGEDLTGTVKDTKR